MPAPEGFYDLLFEVSNEYRHGILLLIQAKAFRITYIAKEMGLNNPETMRHVSRLQEVGLIQRDVGGYYNLTPCGEASMLLVKEFEFQSTNRALIRSSTRYSTVNMIGYCFFLKWSLHTPFRFKLLSLLHSQSGLYP
ncbi:MAG: winged helix-turn-helix domain-containing protein [Candidatus Bathyarchaeota archaeon]|nr:winged helix-turn-helix domain-containing protein [Candidatus Bathyarchaeota archaeon]